MNDQQSNTHGKYHWYKAYTEQRAYYEAYAAYNFGKHHKPKRERCTHTQGVGEIFGHLIESCPLCNAMAEKHCSKDNARCKEYYGVAYRKVWLLEKKILYFFHNVNWIVLYYNTQCGLKVFCYLISFLRCADDAAFKNIIAFYMFFFCIKL